MGGFAWVTLATNDSYSLGALVLAYSLRRVGSPHDLVILITPGVSQSMRERLASVFTVVQEVDVLDSKDETNLAVLKRPELGITFTKLHCWKLTQYEKCVFVDADALVVKNCDELFEREELSAAPDVGWPDCFNSGVFVYRPSEETFSNILAFAASHGSFDGADQGLLNMYFNEWAHKDISKHLPFIYNMCSVAMYSYAPAFKQYGENVKIIHFIGATKPWLQYFDTLTGIAQPPQGCSHLQPLIQTWWNIFCDNVHSQLTDSMQGIAASLSKLTLGESRSSEQQAMEDHIRKQKWEQGQIDYMGQDSFDNILKKLNETIAAGGETSSEGTEQTDSVSKVVGKGDETAAENGADQLDARKPEILLEDFSMQIPIQPALDNLSTAILLEQQTLDKVASDIQAMNILLTEQKENPEKITNEPVSSEPAKVELKSEVDSSQTSTLVAEAETVQLQLEQQQTTGIVTQISAASGVIVSLISTGSPKSESTAPETVLSDSPQIVASATTECPVPIQVAESVLQTDLNQSVSEGIVSSVPRAVQESVAAVSETLVEAGQSSLPSAPQTQQLNGNDPSLQAEDDKIAPAPVTSTALVFRNPNTVSIVHGFAPRIQSEIQLQAEQSKTTMDSKPEDSKNIERSEFSLEITPTVASDIGNVEKIKAEEKRQQLEMKINLEKSTSLTGEPMETKENLPEIPTQTPAFTLPMTTPASETLDKISPAPEAENAFEMQMDSSLSNKNEISAEEQKGSTKKVKKMVKKSSAESDATSSPESEGSIKKSVKKVVKKVVKKSKDGEEGESSNEKKKIVKKLTKTSSTSSETDKPASENTSTASEVPVPPKRKAKSVTKGAEKPDQS